MADASTYPITSANSMMQIIREVGIIPFSRSAVRGWSIEEYTHPDWWPFSSGELGVWDWKVDAVREGFIYGKYISRKSTFATERMYRHLMNWRRSLPVYRVAEGGRCKATTVDGRLQKYLSPILLSAIREHGALDSTEIRAMLDRDLPLELRKKVGGHVEKYLIPKVTKQAVDFLLGYLDMGTWTVIGDITRVYRGANCEYTGWQRNSITTPDALLGASPESRDTPSWAKFVDTEAAEALYPDCSPEESRQFIIDRLTALFPDGRKAFEKCI